MWPAFGKPPWKKISASPWEGIGCSGMIEKAEQREELPSLWKTPSKHKSLLSAPILFYSNLCPSTAGSNPPPESSNFLCPLLSLSRLLPVAPQCHLSNDILVFQLILHPLSATVLLIVHRPSIIFHSGDVSSPFPFCFGYVLDYVTLVLCLMMVRILSFSSTLSIFLSMARWLVSSFFTNAFVKRPCLASTCCCW